MRLCLIRLLGWLGSASVLFVPTPYGQTIDPAVPLQTTAGTGFTGAPYSGKETVVTIRTLSDGTETTQVSEMLLWRDKQGRTRHEFIEHNESGGEFHSIILSDPITGVYRKWETGETSGKRVVNILPLEAGMRATTPAAPPDAVTQQPAPATQPNSQAIDQTIVIEQSPVVDRSPANSGVQLEKLPPQFINGMWAEGSRTVRYIAIDAKKDAALVPVVNELWISPALKIIVRRVQDDPRTGRTTADVTDVALGDPDPALFEAPQGYQVVDHR